MEKVISSLFIFLLFCGCDYWCDYEYNVINNTNDTIKIKIDRSWGYHSRENDDTIKVVIPMSTMTMLEGDHLCGKYYKPEDLRYSMDSTLFWGKYFTEISANNKQLDSTFWNSTRWYFTSKRRLGIYELTITQDEIK